jgi:hypothetical protein
MKTIRPAAKPKPVAANLSINNGEKNYGITDQPYVR